ncbi:MAG: trehalose-phosphatase [Microscillaceae bacterium]|nr:trehalose-phosphatase [Microscillaceae bacterium]
MSVDRLDYSKGIPQRVKAFEQFLSQYPEYLGQVTLILVAVPSRSGVEHYQQLKEEIDTLVGRINGQYARFDWTPIEYYYRGFPFSELLQLYRVADVALITPLRDGMNLIAKEYVSTRQDKKGVLILSEMAGASYELSEALLINPQNQGRLVEAIRQALTMPETEQAQRLTAMQTKIKTNDVKKWAKTFIDEQLKLIEMQAKRKTRLLTPGLQNNFVAQFAQANRRLLLLDYDGTLVNFQINPKEAQPDESLLALLTQLAQSPQNQVVIISGRQRDTLETWLGHLPIDISAEHGVWTRIAKDWERSTGLTDTWKEKVRPALETLVERTVGSFIEEKEYSMAWHYRNTDRELGEKRVREIRDVLQYLTANLGLKVLEGNKVLEIKNEAVNKRAVCT